VQGSDYNAGYGIAVDGMGNAGVTGITGSNYFPITPGARQAPHPYQSNWVFVTVFNANGSGLVYFTYLDVSAWSVSSGGLLAVDPSGNVYVTAATPSYTFPTTPGAFQPSLPGDQAAFVTKLSFIIGPLTTATFNGPSGNNGWYLGAVTVTLSTIAGNNPISATYYSVDNCPYQGYGAPFPISGDGVHQLSFYSADTAGNQETPQYRSILIDAKPVSRVAALPTTAASPNFSVQWPGTDATSAIRDYTIYISDNDAFFTPWLSQTTATQAWFAGFLGHTYAFHSEARDIAGNVESKNGADATTKVPAQMAADVNSDGQIDCADIAIVKASFGKKTGQTGFNPRADVNHDGIVDVRDLAIVSQKLIPGTKCP
jgi:hypothetical protein